MVDLLGETPEKPSKPKAAKKKAATDGAVARLWAVYDAEFKRKWGSDTKSIITSPGRAGRHLKDLKNVIGEDETAQLIRDFFASTDRQIVGSNYTIEDIYKKAQYLRLSQKRGHEQDAKTVANIEAAARAVRRR